MRQHHKESITEYFSDSIPYYKALYDENPKREFFRGLEMKWRKAHVLGLLDTYAPKKTMRVLDVGCGLGNYMRSALMRGHKAFGMDITMDMASTAAQTTRECWVDGKPILLGDVNHIPFPNKSFDAVLCIGVLQYLPKDLKAIKEISRVVRSGGIAIVTAPNLLKITNMLDPYYYTYLAPRYIWHKLAKTCRKNKKPTGYLDFKYNTDFSNKRYIYGQLTHQFLACNLVNVQTRSVGFGPLTFFRKEILPTTWSGKLSDGFIKLMRIKGLNKLNLFANRWVFCLKKQSDLN